VTDQARKLLESIDTSNVVGLRDRALIGVMVYTFARVDAVVSISITVDSNAPAARHPVRRLLAINVESVAA
jgi:hypothetical protein